jgi:hypothetical protein
VVPDLSYKKKDVEDLLIDTEAHFIENRYHFEPPKQTSTPVMQPPPVYSPPIEVQPVIAQTYTPSIVTPSPLPPPSANLLSEMDGLLFLGVQPEPSPPKVETSTMPIPPVPVKQPISTPQSNQVITAPPVPIQPVIPTTNPQPQLPSYNYSQINMNQPYQPYPVMPPAYTPPYAAGGYYNQPLPYNNSMANPYFPFGYQQQNYSPMMAPTNPYINQQQIYPSYQSPPQTNNYPSYPQTPISYSAASHSFSPTIESKPTPPPNPYPPPANKNDDDFGDFKNGGSFDIQKVLISLLRSVGCPTRRRTLLT